MSLMSETANAAAAAPARSRRIIEFDLLRGFFIVIITLDHLSYWPSPLAFISGRGWLWVSAAEGFFLISGFLIGYLRAYKGRDKPLWPITVSLWRRALKLYLWGVAISLYLRIFTEFAPTDNTLPDFDTHASLAEWGDTVLEIVTMQGFLAWIFFLRMYTVMLLLTPLFLLLVRKGLVWAALILSVAGYWLSFLREVPDAELQWQVLFFGAAVLGYFFNPVRNWLGRNRTWRVWLITVLIVTTVSTIALSALAIHGAWLFELAGHADAHRALAETTNWHFSNNPMQPGRILLSFLWFGGFLALFHVLRDPINRWLGWLLRPLGQMSLTGYCLQAIILPPIVVITSARGPVWNTVIGIVTILLIWLLMKSKLVQTVLPQ